MADHVSLPVAGLERRRADSPWAPLREPLFRSLWIAAVVSYTGTWMRNVGAGVAFWSGEFVGLIKSV